jgi:hypothetical protein
MEASPTSPRVSLPGGSASGSAFEYSPLAPAVGLAALGDASEAAREGELLGLWPDAWSTELIAAATNHTGFAEPEPGWFAEDTLEDGRRQDGQESLWARVSGLQSPPVDAGVTPAARGMMQTLTQHAHRPLWSPTPLPSETTLSAHVSLFLRHFSWLPILDNFEAEKAAPLLLKAMAGVGSVYAHEPGVMELVRRDLLFITEHDTRFAHDIAVVQATLLSAVYGAFSGSQRLTQHAELSRTSLVSSARKMGLLGGTPGEDEEEQRRLGWCIFVSHLVALPVD